MSENTKSVIISSGGSSAKVYVASLDEDPVSYARGNKLFAFYANTFSS